MVADQLVEHVELAQFGEREVHDKVVGRGRLGKTSEKEASTQVSRMGLRRNSL